MRLKSKALFALFSTSLVAGQTMPALAQTQPTQIQPQAAGISPALCSPGDLQEPGIQGEVPAGQTANYNCGVRLVGQLPIAGNVAGTGRCAYVRSRGSAGTPNEANIAVVDVSNPSSPLVVGKPLSVHNGTETFRLVVTHERAVMVSGSSVFDISDCLHPKFLGEIVLPDTALPGVARKNFPHDMRLNRTGTKVYYSFGVWDADISNLNDPKSWTVTDHRCEVAAQIPGPWQEVHRLSIKAGRSLCDDATKPRPTGSGYLLGASPLQASLLWPQVSHSPDLNADGTRLYVGDQAGGNAALWAPEPKVRIFNLTKAPYTIIGEVNGPGHGLDWFRSGGREYLLHSNEGGTKGIATQAEHGDSCRPYTGRARTVLDYSQVIARLVREAKDPGFSQESWAPLAAMIDTARFVRVGNFKEVMNWEEYTAFLTSWAADADWECSFKRITEQGNLVFLELEEHSRVGGHSNAVNSISLYEFDEAGRIIHIDVYLQMPLPDLAMLQGYADVAISG